MAVAAPRQIHPTGPAAIPAVKAAPPADVDVTAVAAAPPAAAPRPVAVAQAVPDAPTTAAAEPAAMPPAGGHSDLKIAQKKDGPDVFLDFHFDTMAFLIMLLKGQNTGFCIKTKKSCEELSIC